MQGMTGSLSSRFDPAPRLAREVRRRLRGFEPGPARIQLRVTLGFLSLTALASLAGRSPRPLLGLMLLAVALAHELPRALLARRAGRSAKVSIDAGGGRTELAGAAPSARLALGLAVVGSCVSLALGALQLWGARALMPGTLAALMSESGHLHLVWGIAHLLPFLPFKVGGLLSSHLVGTARLKHALLSLLFALVLIGTLVHKLTSPLLFVAACALVFACVRAFARGLASAHDLEIDADRRLDAIDALIMSGSARRATFLARELLAEARAPALQTRVRRALAWAAIGATDASLSAEALSQLDASAVDYHLLAAHLATANRRAEAIELLEEARCAGVRSTESVKLLIDLYFRQEQLELVSQITAAEQALLSSVDVKRIERAVELAKAAAQKLPPARVPDSSIPPALLPPVVESSI